MTTIVKITTHDWPAVARIDNNYEHRDSLTYSEGYSHSEQFIPAHDEREFVVTDTQSVSFSELPKDATGLPYCEDCRDEIEIIGIAQDVEEEAAVN